MKKFLCLICVLIGASAKAEIQITPEFGGNVGLNQSRMFQYGAYARLWLGVNKFVFAPQVRWELNNEYSNIKAGLMIGGEVKEWLTPYAGISYSIFNKKYENSFDTEIGLVFFMPYFSVGVYGNWGLTDLRKTKQIKHIFGGGLSLGIPF